MFAPFRPLIFVDLLEVFNILIGKPVVLGSKISTTTPNNVRTSLVGFLCEKTSLEVCKVQFIFHCSPKKTIDECLKFIFAPQSREQGIESLTAQMLSLAVFK